MRIARDVIIAMIYARTGADLHKPATGDELLRAFAELREIERTAAAAERNETTEDDERAAMFSNLTLHDATREPTDG